MLTGASGIFITGGTQAHLVELLTGTRAMECIRERSAEGVVVAGTSAGASILASHLMLGGTGRTENSNDAAARKHMVELAAGSGCSLGDSSIRLGQAGHTDTSGYATERPVCRLGSGDEREEERRATEEGMRQPVAPARHRPAQQPGSRRQHRAGYGIDRQVSRHRDYPHRAELEGGQGGERDGARTLEPQGPGGHRLLLSFLSEKDESGSGEAVAANGDRRLDARVRTPKK